MALDRAEAFGKKFSISDDIKIRFPNPNEEFLINQKADLDLGLAEVLYCYSLKKKIEKQETYYLSTIKKSHSLVNGLPDCKKGWMNGYVVLSGRWEFGAWEEHQLWATPRVLGNPVKRGRLVHTLSSERSKVVAQAFKLKGRSMEELLTPENVDSVISNRPASFVGTIDMLVPSPRCLRKFPDYPLPSPSASDAEAGEMDEFSLPRVVQHHNKIGDGPSWSSKRPATAIPVAIPVKKANPSQTPCKANIIDLSPDDPGVNSPDNFDTFETEPPVQETPAPQSHVRTAPSDTQSPVRMSSVPNASQLLLTIFGTSASDVSSNLLGQGFSSMCKALDFIFKELSQRLHARNSEYSVLLDEFKLTKQLLREERHQKLDAQARADKLALEVASARRAREKALSDLEMVESELAAERAHAAEANTQFAKEKRKAMFELRDRLTVELEKQVKEAQELGFRDGYAACKAARK
ncbi:hypothetical protein AAG906_013315 [Vitis piasezkii]